MATYLDQFTAETLPDLDACVVMSDHQVRFTPLGMKRYRERFGRAGIDINRIKTREAFLDALEASFPVEMEAFARQVKANGGDRLEQRYLIALATCERVTGGGFCAGFENPLPLPKVEKQFAA